MEKNTVLVFFVTLIFFFRFLGEDLANDFFLRMQSLFLKSLSIFHHKKLIFRGEKNQFCHRVNF